MANSRKHVFGTKRGLVFIGVILFICVGGLVLLAKRIIQPGIFTPANATPVPIVLGTPQSSDGDSDKYKIGVELSEGQSQPQTVEVLPATSGEPLSPEEIELIFSRLPALTPDPDQQTDFNLPQEILPPPRPGNTIEETFRPDLDARNRTNSGGGGSGSASSVAIRPRRRDPHRAIRQRHVQSANGSARDFERSG